MKGKPEALFFDSNVYISVLRSKEYIKRIEPLLQGAYLYVISKIVLMELWAGARNKTEEEILELHQKTNLLIGLSDDNFIKAGQVMSKMRHKYNPEPSARRRMTWDILIALSAAENNAVVVTANQQDFRKISTFVKFDHFFVES